MIENQIEQPSHLKLPVQVTLAIFLILSSTSIGMIHGYSAILLPQLNATEGRLQIDEELGSWIASINIIAVPLGSLVCGVLIDVFGRKKILEGQIIIAIISWVIISCSQDFATLLTGRVIGGFTVGVFAIVGQVYAAEMSDPRVSGIFNSIPFSSCAFGILLVYVLGAITHWKSIAEISIIVAVISGVPLFFLPESPSWSVKKNNILKFTEKFSAETTGEAESLLKSETKTTIEEKLDLFRSPKVLKPFCIVTIFKFLQTLAGVHIFIFYAIDLIAQMKIEYFSDSFIAISTAAIRVIFTIFANILLAFIGRRSIGLMSCIGTTASAVILGTLLYVNEGSSLILTVCLFSYIATSTIGLSILPGMMIGELFPLNARGLVGGLTYTLFSIFSFGVSKLFPLIKHTLQIYGLFWLFSGASALAGILIYLFLPETKNKSLNAIENYFSQSNILWTTRNNYHSTNSNDSCKCNVGEKH